VLTAYTGALNEILLVGGLVALASAVLCAVLIHDADFFAPPGGEPAAPGSGG